MSSSALPEKTFGSEPGSGSTVTRSGRSDSVLRLPTPSTLTFLDTTNLTAELRADAVYIRNLGTLSHTPNTATATDGNGNSADRSRRLRVFDPADTQPPQVEITSPAQGDVVTYLTDIVGTVTDANLEFYRLQYSLVGAEQWVTIHEGTANVVNGVLGTLLSKNVSVSHRGKGKGGH